MASRFQRLAGIAPAPQAEAGGEPAPEPKSRFARLAAPEPEKMGAGQAFATGLADSGTLGFNDEAAGVVAGAANAVGLGQNYQDIPRATTKDGKPIDLWAKKPDGSYWFSAKVREQAPRVAVPEKQQTFGEAYEETRDAVRADQDKAKADQGLAYGAGALTGVLATPALGAAKAANWGARVGLGALSSAVAGAGDSRATDASGVAVDALKAGGTGAAIGLGFKAVGETVRGAKRLVQKQATGIDPRSADVQPIIEGGKRLPGKAESEYRHQVIEAMQNGAEPTAKKRAFRDDASRQGALELVESTPRLKKAVDAKDQDEMFAAAEEVIDAESKMTRPKYEQLDKAVGLVPADKLLAGIDDEILRLRKNGDSSTNPLIKSMEEMKENFIAKVRANSDGDGPLMASHKLMREFETGLLKAKNLTVGAMAETPAYVFKNELHQTFREQANRHYDEISAFSPDVRRTVDEIRESNRRIAPAFAIRDVTENALERGERVKPTRGQIVERQAKEARDQIAQSGGITSLLTVPLKRRALEKLGATPERQRAKTENQVRAYGELAMKIRKGETPAVIEAARDRALEAGVPEKMVRLLLNLTP